MNGEYTIDFNMIFRYMPLISQAKSECVQPIKDYLWSEDEAAAAMLKAGEGLSAECTGAVDNVEEIVNKIR